MRCPECGALAAQEQTEADHAYALLESAEARIETLQNALLAAQSKLTALEGALVVRDGYGAAVLR